MSRFILRYTNPRKTGMVFRHQSLKHERVIRNYIFARNFYPTTVARVFRGTRVSLRNSGFRPYGRNLIDQYLANLDTGALVGRVTSVYVLGGVL